MANPTVANPLPNIVATGGQPISVDAAGVFADLDVIDKLTYSVAGLPPGTGLAMASNTGVLSGTASQLDVTESPFVTVRTTDEAANFAEATLQLSPVSGAPAPQPTAPPPPGSVAAPASVGNPAVNFHPGYYSTQGNATDAIPPLVLTNDDLLGSMIGIQWKDIETAFGVYDFSIPDAYLATLQAAGKRLCMRLQLTEFGSGPPATPTYMHNDASYGGDAGKYGNRARTAQNGGWSTYLENQKVRDRYTALVTAIGQHYATETNFEFLTLGETSMGRVLEDKPAVELGFKTALLAAKTALAGKSVMLTLNFASWATGKETGLAQWCRDNGIGLGAPDLKSGNGTLDGSVWPAMLTHHADIPTAPEVQWSDYNPRANEDKTVAGIRDFGIAVANPWYILWRNREPWWNGAPTDPVAGGNVQAMTATPLPAAAAFYASLP